jgi:hypothetical protein
MAIVGDAGWAALLPATTSMPIRTDMKRIRYSGCLLWLLSLRDQPRTGSSGAALLRREQVGGS